MIQPAFVHLHVHSEYSLVDSVVRLKPMLTQVAETMPAVALTDFTNMVAAVKFYRACLGQAVKPILGCEVLLVDDLDAGSAFPLILLVADNTGYRHLTEIVSLGYLQGQRHGRALVQRDWVSARAEGLIALSGGMYGEIGQALLNGHETQAAALLQWSMRTFPQRFYLELTRCGRAQEEAYVWQDSGKQRNLHRQS